jgi:phage terminase large subunit
MDIKQRALLLQKAEGDIELQQYLLRACELDPVYWFNTFAYTFDPRDGKGCMPFNLYPYQEWFIPLMKEKIDAQKDIDIEKSRTMGATWMLMGLFLWYWLFVPGSSFLIGSITQDDVDKNLVDPEDTMFGKIRFMFEYLPPWMRPKHHDKHLVFKNEVNNNQIVGKAPVANFGRSARKTAILFDEIAFWQWARPAYASASQTTKCRIMCSTPNGKYNIYGEKMTDPSAKRLVWPGRNEMVIAKGING